MSHQLKEVSTAKSSRAASYDSNFLAGRFGAFRRWNLSGKICGNALQSADIDGVVYHVATASGFARMFTDISACSWKWVVFADQSYCICIAAFSYKCDVSRDINLCRTERNTRYWLVERAGTASLTDMFFVVFPVADKAFVYHMCGFIADCTVSRIHDGKRKIFHQIKCFQSCLSVKNICDQIFKLSKSDTARDTLSTSLCMTKFQKCSGYVDRT